MSSNFLVPYPANFSILFLFSRFDTIIKVYLTTRITLDFAEINNWLDRIKKNKWWVRGKTKLNNRKPFVRRAKRGHISILGIVAYSQVRLCVFLPFFNPTLKNYHTPVRNRKSITPGNLVEVERSKVWRKEVREEKGYMCTERWARKVCRWCKKKNQWQSSWKDIVKWLYASKRSWICFLFRF